MPPAKLGSPEKLAWGVGEPELVNWLFSLDPPPCDP